VTKRTLRRDFEKMLKEGIIERLGERNNTFYQIKTVQS
jgi:Fic family protein